MVGQLNKTMSPLEKLPEIIKTTRNIIFRCDVGKQLIWWFLGRTSLFQWFWYRAKSPKSVT